MKQACSVFLSFFLFVVLDTSAKFVLHVSYNKINVKKKMGVIKCINLPPGKEYLWASNRNLGVF